MGRPPRAPPQGWPAPCPGPKDEKSDLFSYKQLDFGFARKMQNSPAALQVAIHYSIVMLRFISHFKFQFSNPLR
jgi:hypothetical protein